MTTDWGALLGAVAGFISGIFASLATTALTEPKKQRAEDYNKIVDRLVIDLEKLQEVATRYWLNSEYSEYDKMLILQLITSISGSILSAYVKQKGIFEEADAASIFRTYREIITGTGFSSAATHAASPSIIENSLKYFEHCKRTFESYRYVWTIWHLSPWSKIR